MKRVIYTVIIGDYEQPIPLDIKSKGFDHIILTDNKDIKVNGWNIKYIKPSECPLKQSRELKINIHKYLDYDLYVYIDANYRIHSDLNGFVNNYFRGGYTTLIHPQRKCIFEEAKRVVHLAKDKKEIVFPQMQKYQREGMPLNFGLYMNGFFIRDKSFNDICEQWFNEVKEHSYRDQLSLTYVLWKNKIKITAFRSFSINPYLKLEQHNKNEVPNIYHFVPGAGDKNLGRELNKHCEIVPNDDDWIVIRDNDTAYLHPFINKQLEDIIKRHGNNYEIFSCMTNRLGLEYQLPYGLMDERDIVKLREIAEKHYKEYYDEVVPCSFRQPTAGLFSMFQKKTWEKLKYQDGLANSGGFIDWRFTMGHLRKGHRIGICKGIFLFHYYRMHQDNWREYEHLKP